MLILKLGSYLKRLQNDQLNIAKPNRPILASSVRLISVYSLKKALPWSFQAGYKFCLNHLFDPDTWGPQSVKLSHFNRSIPEMIHSKEKEYQEEQTFSKLSILTIQKRRLAPRAAGR